LILLDKVKQALRISNTTYDLDEITDLINAAILDLQSAGIIVEKAVETTDDPLITRAIVTYCKAHFGWNNPDSINLNESYQNIKAHLSLSVDYAYYAVTFIVKNGTTPIKYAKVIFGDTEKYTDATGSTKFYTKEAVHQEYYVIADGYATINDYADITTDTTINVAVV